MVRGEYARGLSLLTPDPETRQQALLDIGILSKHLGRPLLEQVHFPRNLGFLEAGQL